MGYTHYFYRKVVEESEAGEKKYNYNISTSTWDNIKKDVLLLFDYLKKEKKLSLAGANGDPTEIKEAITDDFISFNGDSCKYEDYEPFEFSKNLTNIQHLYYSHPALGSASSGRGEKYQHIGWVYGCCKTGQQPYNIAVCGVLIILKHYLENNLIIDSDGDLTDKDWRNAKKVCQNCLSYGNNFILDR